jgi:hypothetical protein
VSLYKQFKTDESIEKEGVVLDYGEHAKFRIARAGGGNKRFLRAAENFRRKYRRQLGLDILKEEVAVKEAIDIYAKTVVLPQDWDVYWPDENGEDVPLSYSVDNVKMMFTALPDLFRDVQAQAMNSELFREVIDEEDAKN